MCFTPPLLPFDSILRHTLLCGWMLCWLTTALQVGVRDATRERVVCETSGGTEAKLFETISQPKILRLSLFGNNSCGCCAFPFSCFSTTSRAIFPFPSVIALYCYMWFARRLPATWLMVDKRKEIWWIVKIASSYTKWGNGKRRRRCSGV